MKDQINTIREALEIERFACTHESIKVPEHLVDALTALAQIEAAVGEPVAFVTDADVACFGKGAQGEIAALLHRQGKWCHPLFTVTPVAQQYEAGDMASAAAQGFRDGAASVAQQPQKLEDIERYRMQMAGICTAAMGYWKEGDSIHPDYDTPALRDVAKLYAKYDALYKAQQPQAEDTIKRQAQRIAELTADRDGWIEAHARLHREYHDFRKEAQQPQAEAVPNVCASFYTESAELIGTTEAPIKRVEREDDGTLHVYIDHWPQQAEAVQACGHPMSLLLRSAESNEPLYCEACDDKSGRHDAERRETELLDANRRLQEKIASADALKLHAIEELCQLGYTVKEGELIPPDHLHKLVEAAGHPLAAPQQAEAVPLDNETKTMKLMGLVDDLIEADPDRAERFIETVLGRNALQKRLKQSQSKEPQAEAVPPGFEVWLRTVCFQRPTPEAYDLAKAAWRAAIAQQKGQP